MKPFLCFKQFCTMSSNLQAGIPISDQLLSDLIESLDQDCNELIDYREFVRGMKNFRIDDRQRKRFTLAQRKELFGYSWWSGLF